MAAGLQRAPPVPVLDEDTQDRTESGDKDKLKVDSTTSQTETSEEGKDENGSGQNLKSVAGIWIQSAGDGSIMLWSFSFQQDDHPGLLWDGCLDVGLKRLNIVVNVRNGRI